MKHTVIPMVLALAAGGALHAQVYQYGIGDPDKDSILDPGSLGYNSNAGYVDELFTQYNAGTGRFDFSVDFSAKGGVLADSFWVVVNDGPDPKNHVEEYAIFFFDGTDVATGGDAVVTSYVYSGANSSSSWETPGMTLLSSLNADPISATGSIVGDVAAFTFSVETSVLNDASQWPGYGLGAEWDGAQFADHIGVWFHPVVANGDPQYGAVGTAKEGFLTDFDVLKQGWVDVQMQQTVPEPSAALLGALGGLGLLLRRSRK